MQYLAIAWFVAMVVFIWIEASTISVVSLWFAVGALAALITSLCGGEIWLQAVVFLGVSVILLYLLRPVIRKYFTPKLTKTNIDALIGTVGRVTAAIDNDAAQGQIKLGAMEWTARSVSGAQIKEGTLVKVEYIEGVKVFVSPADVPVGTK
jgi:membrane protein implicated in regulation of membrane protease activity